MQHKIFKKTNDLDLQLLNPILTPSATEGFILQIQNQMLDFACEAA